MTSLKDVNEAFFSLITDDMYLEISEEETKKDLKRLLNSSILLFEFPSHVIEFENRTNINGEDTSVFTSDLTLEEINILAQGMVLIWIERQINSVEKMRQITSGADFKISSQAAHLRQLENEYEKNKERFWHLQALHSRRRRSLDGKRYESNFDLFIKPIN